MYPLCHGRYLALMSFLILLASSFVLDPRFGGRHGGRYGGGGILLGSESLEESDEMLI